MSSISPSSYFLLPASLKGKKLLRCHTEITPWTAEFPTGVVRIRGMLEPSEHGLMQWSWTHIWSALCKTRKSGDVIHDDDDIFNILSAPELASCPPNAYSSKLVYLMFTDMPYKFLTYPS